MWGLYAFIFADVWINSYTDPNTSEDLTLQMVAFWYCLPPHVLAVMKTCPKRRAPNGSSEVYTYRSREPNA